MINSRAPLNLAERFGAFARRADAYFLSDALRSESASRVANTRMGLLFWLLVSAGTLLFVPFQVSIWRMPAVLLAVGVASFMLALPFVLRQTPRIRWLGQLICAVLALSTATSIWLSAGHAIAILPFLPLLPVIGLLVGGRNTALFWSAAALAVATLGLILLKSGQPAARDFMGSTDIGLYAITVTCIVGMGAIAQLFEIFWNRTAIEVANRAQAELVAREERNRSFLEHAAEGVMMVDANAIVRFASPAAERLVGVEPGGAMGHRLREFTTPEDFDRTQPVWQAILAEPESVGQLSLSTRPNLGRGDPNTSKVLDIVVTNRLSNPAVEGLVVRMRDITELARAEANYQALVEHSLQGIAVECNGWIVYANQALADLFMVSRQRLLQKATGDPLNHVHALDRETIRQRFMNSKGTLGDSIEMRCMRGDGTWRWVEVHWTEASWEGRPARQILYADITAQKDLAAHQERETERLEAAIRERTSELEASQNRLREQERMAVVGTLAAGIAHQINNPVGAILTSADFAILTAGDDDAEEIRTGALEEIRTQAIRCGKIVRSVLQFSRSEPTEKWSSGLTGVLRTAVDVTTHYANERGAEIHLSLAPESSGCMIRMNPIELEQVFVNLIRNAIETKPSGARVFVSTYVMGDEIEISVEDDGPGVSEAHSRHLFEPFYTTRLREGGTGLGLSVAHGIVEDHGGRMWFENLGTARNPETFSPATTGARFRIRLPIEVAEVAT